MRAVLVVAATCAAYVAPTRQQKTTKAQTCITKYHFHLVVPQMCACVCMCVTLYAHTDATTHREQYKVLLIEFSNAVVDPRTVMVHAPDTVFTCADNQKYIHTIIGVILNMLYSTKL